jgi:hypothetical protein
VGHRPVAVFGLRWHSTETATLIYSLDRGSDRVALIVTNCSKRKRLKAPTELRADRLSTGSLDDVARQWLERVKHAHLTARAAKVYCGRQFAEVLRSASLLQTAPLIVSAGLGVVRSDAFIPNYSLTVAAGAPDNVLALVNEAATATDWWQTLIRNSENIEGLTRSLKEITHHDEPILIAMPASYIAMIKDELEQLALNTLNRVRIFTSPNFRFQTHALNRTLMPYDDRLDGAASPIRGTVTDFSARALSHFTVHILSEFGTATADEHAARVKEHLGTWARRGRPERIQHSDDDLIHLIRQHWVENGQSASRMLRVFRDELGIACEQSRMKRLYDNVRRQVELAP